MKRQGLYAINDSLIRRLARDPDYRILRNGQIWTRRNLNGKGTSKTWRISGCPHHDVRGSAGGGPYWRISYEGKKLPAHRVIWARHGATPLNSDLVINHLDGNGLNNAIGNLELTTQARNNTHRFRVLGYSGVKGHRKINLGIARSIRAKRAAGASYCDLMAEFRVCKSTISYVVNGITWREELPAGRRVAA